VASPRRSRTQRDPVHLYQRPDGPLTFDPDRTSLTGTNLELRFAQVGGQRLRFETAYQRRTPGFEINDLGFLRQADQQMWTSWANLAFRKPNRVFRELRWNFNHWEHWSIAGLPTERAFNTNVHTQLNNRWWLRAGAPGQMAPPTAIAAPEAARDPAGPYIAPWATSRDNRALIPSFW
jgi:hypothetical protein